MTVENKTCHGQWDCMMQGSGPVPLRPFHQCFWRIWAAVIHLKWHLNNKGFIHTLKYTGSKILKFVGIKGKCDVMNSTDGTHTGYVEVLNLKPGELVEVKSEQEIAATLDANGRNRGLYFMGNMRTFCGKRYRVYKRLETILLESDGQLRKVKNTVLLENVYCGGTEHYGCDRSCFHYWREAWLKRVDGQ
jgi:hypothetical protein